MSTTYFVWEEDREGVQSFFAQVIYNHLAQSLGWDLNVKAEAKLEFILKTVFTQEEAFVQPCRAAEGNCRDLLNIFRMSYSEFHRDAASKLIGIPHVKTAAE